MRVSILIPTLNRLPFLKDCLASARAQTHPDLEIIVSDDGSADGTTAYLADVVKEDPRVRIPPPNPSPGIFTNMQHLVSASSGDAFCLLGDDDRIDADYVACLIAPMLEDEGVVATFCDHRIIDSKGRVLDKVSRAHSMAYGRTNLPGGPLRDPVTAVLAQSMCLGFAMYRAKPFRTERFDLACGPAADLDYVIRATALGTLYFVPACLGDYRVHPGTATLKGIPATNVIRALDNHSFPNPSHERRRRRMLKAALKQGALQASTDSAVASIKLLLRYFQLGGTPFEPRVALTTLLALAPRSVARSAFSFIARARAHVRSLRPARDSRGEALS